MGLLDKLVDKVIDSAKKKKTDSTIEKLKKSNPKLAKAVDKHQRSYEEMRAEIERLAKEKGVKL
tara:strand:+ start:1266 stop:1457 length:192 start_codon:yes stop_codon:yes gene_type:complete